MPDESPTPVSQDDLSRDLADFELAHQARLDAGAASDAAAQAAAVALAAKAQAIADLSAAQDAEQAAKSKLFSDADAYSAE